MAWISASLHERYGQEVDQAEVQIGILTGDVVTYLPQWSGRVAFPLAQVLVSQLGGISSVAAFVALRHVTLVVALLAVWLVARRSMDEGQADRVTLTVAVLLVLSFNHAWQTPTDAIDVLVFALGTSYALQGRFRAMLTLALVASANRESSLFLALLWAGSQVGSRPWRRLAGELGALAFGAVAVVLTLRYVTAGWAGLAPPDMAGLATTAINVPQAMTIPLGLAMLGLCGSMGVPSRGIAVACLAMVLLSAMGGTAHELRIYLPAVTVWALASAQAPQQHHAHQRDDARQQIQ